MTDVEQGDAAVHDGAPGHVRCRGTKRTSAEGDQEAYADKQLNSVFSKLEQTEAILKEGCAASSFSWCLVGRMKLRKLIHGKEVLVMANTICMGSSDVKALTVEKSCIPGRTSAVQMMEHHVSEASIRRSELLDQPLSAPPKPTGNRVQDRATVPSMLKDLAKGLWGCTGGHGLEGDGYDPNQISVTDYNHHP
jgi:hypothetical protein